MIGLGAAPPLILVRLPAAGRLAIRASWGALLDALDDLAFPRVCPVCDGDADPSAFCGPCRADLLSLTARGSTCPRCALPVGPFARLDGGCAQCRGRALGFDSASSLGPYAGALRRLCLRLKHRQDAWLARRVADLVAVATGPSVLPGLAAGPSRGGAGAGATPTPWVVPIPLHWTRRLARGYNQAEALALGLGRAWGLPVVRALRRVGRTPPLASRGRTERARLMRGAFEVRRHWRSALKGRPVVLVDDILTSGATAGAAGRALRAAGARRVVVVVAARAEGKP